MERLTTVEKARRFIRDNPGVSSQLVAEYLGCKRDTVLRMLRHDVAAGNIDTDIVRGMVHYWFERERKGANAAPGATPERILYLLRTRGPLTAPDIAYELQRSQGYARIVLDRMTASGLVLCDPSHRPLRWIVAPR